MSVLSWLNQSEASVFNQGAYMDNSADAVDQLLIYIWMSGFF